MLMDIFISVYQLEWHKIKYLLLDKFFQVCNVRAKNLYKIDTNFKECAEIYSFLESYIALFLHW